jgi:hypothetical protein
MINETLLQILITALAFIAGMAVIFLRSYSGEKGKNLATKEDIRELTRAAEEIKAKISDDVWDRQKQWELRRDAVLGAVRAFAGLESELVSLNSALSVSEKGRTDEADAELKAAFQRFRDSRTSFLHAFRIADLAVGGQLPNTMYAYFHLTGAVSTDMTRKKCFLDGAKSEELALSGKNLILSARQALGIKDAGDLSRPDDSI